MYLLILKTNSDRKKASYDSPINGTKAPIRQVVRKVIERSSCENAHRNHRRSIKYGIFEAILPGQYFLNNTVVNCWCVPPGLLNRRYLLNCWFLDIPDSEPSKRGNPFFEDT